MMTTLYVYRNSRGVEDAEACSDVEEAARVILGHDGHDWEIRPDEDAGFWLWRSRFGGGGRNGGMVKNLIYSAAEERAEAEAEIFAEVVDSSDRYGFSAASVEEYNAILAEPAE